MRVFEYDEIKNIELDETDKELIRSPVELVEFGPVGCAVINDGKSCCLYPNNNSLLDGIKNFEISNSNHVLKEILSGEHDKELIKDFAANNRCGKYCICKKTGEKKYTIILLDGCEFFLKALELRRLFC